MGGAVTSAVATRAAASSANLHADGVSDIPIMRTGDWASCSTLIAFGSPARTCVAQGLVLLYPARYQA
jgi:hypothetical protein